MKSTALAISTALAVVCGSAKGQIQFQDVTQSAGISYAGWTWGASWGDYSGNGFPDLWTGHHGTKVSGGPSLYLNLGDGTFVEVINQIWTPPTHADLHASAWADHDNDSHQELLTLTGANGGAGQGSNFFLVNKGGILKNLAEELGLSYPLGRGRTPLWIDFDEDGVLDVVLSNRLHPNNLAPAAIFRSSLPSDIVDSRPGFSNANSLTGFQVPSATFCLLSDLTLDGRLDIVVANDSFPVKVYDTATLPFTEVSDTIGLPSTAKVSDAVLADFTGDLRPDAFITTYAFLQSAVLVNPTRIEAQLYASQNEVGMTFQAAGSLIFDLRSGWAGNASSAGSQTRLDLDDIYIGAQGLHPPGTVFALSSSDPSVQGIAAHVPTVSKGVYIGYDSGTGTWTLLHSWPPPHNLWCALDSRSPIQALGRIGFLPFQPRQPDRLLVYSNGTWVDQTELSGLGELSSSISAVAGDFDNDMDLDIYVVSTRAVENMPNRLYENLGQGTFVPVPFAGGAEGPTSGRGESVTTADYDRDGFLDLFVTNGESLYPFGWDGPDVLFRNQGNGNHWIEIDLEGSASNRDGIGARVLVTAGGITQVREQGGGMHVNSQNHRRLHFGLGSSTTIERIDVLWPGPLHTNQTLTNVQADQVLKIVESSP